MSRLSFIFAVFGVLWLVSDTANCKGIDFSDFLDDLQFKRSWIKRQKVDDEDEKADDGSGDRASGDNGDNGDGEGIQQDCLDCICQIEGCSSQVGKCRMDMGSLSCGPYQIKEPYWKDCGKPGQDWQTCTKQMECSITCVQNYMSRYATKCTKGQTPTCQDYSKIHNGGPKGCQSSSNTYWDNVNACLSKSGKKVNELIKLIKAYMN